GTGPLCGETSAWCPWGESSRSRRLPRPVPRPAPGVGVDQGGQLVRPRGAAAAADQPAVSAQVEQRGGASDVQLAYLVEVALRVDVHVGQPGAGRLQVLQPGLGGAAGAAERGRELD